MTTFGIAVAVACMAAAGTGGYVGGKLMVVGACEMGAGKWC